ncbi:LysR family transcriptional regulator [Secundilactobacillus collinoides]|uniref:LysR family transcriptional regulator n=2 Tax=Secundilactobacillus collinoides TaxID=33960 RepID=A0A0R2BNY1_SECCO|nr:LysR family transcriptional regulator [Secundilactobacillus collinoides]KRM77835.1 LysR family transcriptional regulator [Secundilactobacillus collinoides DSM 20515 = JCM 1123]KZL38271.1 LysR family transcriptional regulator [Secundilactobacillus collinoides]
MVDNYLLEELVTFAQTGTLAQTAKRLNVTQPTVTRGMQKLEDDLGVALFERQPNRIILTTTGELAAKEAAALLTQQEAFVTKVRNFDQQQRVLSIGATIPGPLLMLTALARQLPPTAAVDQGLQADDQVSALLNSDTFSILFTNQELLTDTIESQFIGNENLAVNLDQFMYHANQTKISFAELKGLSFLVMSDIGPWRDIIQKEIPDATFMYQTEIAAMQQLTAYANFPYFTTNLSAMDPTFADRLAKDDRVNLPITDGSAHMPVYVSYLKSAKPRVNTIIQLMAEHWPK